MAGTNSGPAAGSWRERLISAQLERSLIFSQHLRRAQRRQYPSDVEPKVLKFLDDVNSCIHARLEEISTDPGFADLGDSEAETQLVRFSHLYAQLFSAAALVETTGAAQAVAELIAPLRRILVPALGVTNLFLFPLAEINYGFLDLGDRLNKAISPIGLGNAQAVPHLYTLGFPSLEQDWTLMHCMMGHELGHALYKHFQMAGRVSPLVNQYIDQERIDQFVREFRTALLGGDSQELAEGTSGTQLPLASVWIQAQTKKIIEAILRNWTAEVCCDAIGLYLFGPAFLLSFISFLAGTQSLDFSSTTHPPLRMRLRILFWLLRRRLSPSATRSVPWGAYRRALGLHVASFLKTWEVAVGSKGIEFDDRYREIAGAAIWAAYPEMCNVLDGLVPQQLKYDITSQVGDIQHLETDLLLAITPNEVRDGYGPRPAALASIYNAGWRACLGGVQRLAKENGWSAWEAKAKLNQWVAKGIELAEVQTRWAEVQ